MLLHSFKLEWINVLAVVDSVAGKLNRWAHLLFVCGIFLFHCFICRVSLGSFVLLGSKVATWPASLFYLFVHYYSAAAAAFHPFLLSAYRFGWTVRLAVAMISSSLSLPLFLQLWLIRVGAIQLPPPRLLLLLLQSNRQPFFSPLNSLTACLSVCSLLICPNNDCLSTPLSLSLWVCCFLSLILLACWVISRTDQLARAD